jgi:hypothetical protein
MEELASNKLVEQELASDHVINGEVEHHEQVDKKEKSGFRKSKVPQGILSTLQQIEQQRSVLSVDEEQLSNQVESHELIIQEPPTKNHNLNMESHDNGVSQELMS